jgi:heme-degrading monooxygenase HmoA
MHARLSRFAGLDAERIDDMVKEFESEGLTALEAQDGFHGITVAVNHATGQAFAMSLWDTEEHLRASERAAEQAREQAIATAGPSRAPIVDRYEVVVQR